MWTNRNPPPLRGGGGIFHHKEYATHCTFCYVPSSGLYFFGFGFIRSFWFLLFFYSARTFGIRLSWLCYFYQRAAGDFFENRNVLNENYVDFYPSWFKHIVIPHVEKFHIYVSKIPHLDSENSTSRFRKFHISMWNFPARQNQDVENSTSLCGKKNTAKKD